MIKVKRSKPKAHQNSQDPERIREAPDLIEITKKMAAQDRMAEGVAAKEAQKTDKMIAFHTKHLQQLKEEAALDRFPVMDTCEIFSIFEIMFHHLCLRKIHRWIPKKNRKKFYTIPYSLFLT